MTEGGNYFPRVKEAREALRARALDLFNKHMKLIDMAMAAGDFETANKALQFLEEHMPSQDGERMIEESVDKVSTEKLGSGPQVQIALVVGGLEPKQIASPEVITVEPINQDPTTDG